MTYEKRVMIRNSEKPEAVSKKYTSKFKTHAMFEKAAKIHAQTRAILTLKSVISSLYLRCKNSAKKRSTLIKVIVKHDAPAS